MILSVIVIPPLHLLLPSFVVPHKYVVPVLVNLQLRNHDLAWRYAQRYTRSIRLLLRDSLNVNDVFETVDGGDFALAAFVGSADYSDLVVFANGDTADL